MATGRSLAPLLPPDRLTRRTVTFAAPFFVGEIAEECPAGSYEVETFEELVEGPSAPVYRVVSTSIVIPLSRASRHSYQIVRIDPALVPPAAAAESPHGALGRGKTVSS